MTFERQADGLPADVPTNQISTKRGFPVYRTNPSVPQAYSLPTRTKRINVPGGKGSVIVDNSTVGMTGGQDTILPGGRIPAVVQALGVEPEHIHVVDALPKNRAENARILRKEIAYAGVSVVISVRECLETLRKAKR